MAEAPTIQPQTLPLHLQLRPRKSRTKTGCLTCRTRHRKCDEKQPTCDNCLHRSLACSWPAETRRTSTADARNHGKPATTMATTRAIQVNKSSTGDSTAPSTNMTVPKPLPWRPEGILADASSRSLFEYYILNTANVLVSSRKADNPFLSCVLPRALSDDLILNCVLAMTGAHRAYADADHKYNYLYRKHYALALSQLRREISHSDAGQSIRFLLATLLLTLVEVRSHFHYCCTC